MLIGNGHIKHAEKCFWVGNNKRTSIRQNPRDSCVLKNRFNSYLVVIVLPGQSSSSHRFQGHMALSGCEGRSICFGKM